MPIKAKEVPACWGRDRTDQLLCRKVAASPKSGAGGYCPVQRNPLGTGPCLCETSWTALHRPHTGRPYRPHTGSSFRGAGMPHKGSTYRAGLTGLTGLTGAGLTGAGLTGAGLTGAGALAQGRSMHPLHPMHPIGMQGMHGMQGRVRRFAERALV